MAERKKRLPPPPTDAAAEARRYAIVAIMTLVDIARDTKSPATARVSAASKLLERGFGRIGSATGSALSPDDVDDETLRRLLDQEDGKL